MDHSVRKCLLAINCGSSSIKYAVYEIEQSLQQLFNGEIDGIGNSNAEFRLTKQKEVQKPITIAPKTHEEAAEWLVKWLEKESEFIDIKAIGHRIVQGMQHNQPEKITDDLLKYLRSISAYDPEHLPAELKLIEVFKKHYPKVDQVACFDTAFHNDMPKIAKMLPIPLEYRKKGLKRYGFHGLSYAYIMQTFRNLEGIEKANGKIIIAHLGSGASLAAIKNGKSVDTSMGFTPASGLTMSTRSGDLDPGVAWYLQKFEKLSPNAFNHLINHESGLLGISGTTGDMTRLLQLQKNDENAAAAVEFFCYQCIKWIGAFTAILGGLDTLIFSGGIGEHAPEIRERICEKLKFLGLELDQSKNINNDRIISKEETKISVRVIKTNEEIMIAQSTCSTLNYTIKN
ncbi:MAG: acetate/propionate family kinase [Burkholderiales bacterium]|nr:acetate/propionate family kinase [Bacteroidia bacterium]